MFCNYTILFFVNNSKTEEAMLASYYAQSNRTISCVNGYLKDVKHVGWLRKVWYEVPQFY